MGRKIVSMLFAVTSVASVACTVLSTAQGADLTAPLPVKDPLPDTLSWNGVTFWGVVDVGFGYQTNGAPISSGGYWGLNYNAYADSPAGRGPISSLTANAMQQSQVGIKIDEPLGDSWRAIGALDTGFNPLYGVLADGCSSLIANNGKAASQQTVNSDVSRCGQPFNGNAYGGVSNPTYGTLTFGRQLALASSNLVSYDPMESAFGFSLLGWSGSIAGGEGLSEGSRWDDAVKYAYDTGVFRAGAMYHMGAQDTAIHGNAYAGDVGFTWSGFSVDAVYTVETDGLNAGLFGVGACGTAGTPSCNTLKITATNTEGAGIAGKYVYNLGGGGKTGSPSSNLTFYAGYNHVRNSDPSNPVSVGDTTSNGYIVGAVNNTAYRYGDRLRDVEWVGAKYEVGPWSFKVAYYYLTQDFYKTSATGVYCSSDVSSNCAGTSNTVSGLIDYAVTKHFDVYGGVEWSNLTGGYANGYPVTALTTVTTGMRIKF